MISRPSARRRLVRITGETLSRAKIIDPLGTRDAESPWPVRPGALARCSPEGIRTLATAVRGRRPGPLDDGAVRGVHGATVPWGSCIRPDAESPRPDRSGALARCSPEGIRTLATAARGRRPGP